MKNITFRKTGTSTRTAGPSHDPYGITIYWITERYSDGSELSISVTDGLMNTGEVNGDEFDLNNVVDKILFELYAGMTADELCSMVTYVEHETYKRLPEWAIACMEADARMMANCY